MKTYKKGISLIVLVITIIVIAILVSAVIITLSNANIIGQATEAVVRSDFKGFKEELELYIADQTLAAWTNNKTVYDRNSLNISSTDTTKLYAAIPSLKNSKYDGYVSVIAGEIAIETGAPNYDIITNLITSGALEDIPMPSLAIEGNNLLITTELQAVKAYDIFMEGKVVDTVTATHPTTSYNLNSLDLTTEQISVVAKTTYGSSTANKINAGIKLNVKTTANGTITVKGQSGLTEYSEYELNNNSTIQISATAASGYEFAYWKRVTTDGVEAYLSTSATMEVTPLGTLVHYEPVFISSGSSAKVYVSISNTICGTGDTTPNLPERPGFTVGDWTTYTSTTNVTVYMPTYTKLEGTDVLTIKYFDGTVSTQTFSTEINVTLNATANNTKWLIQAEGEEEVILSYSSSWRYKLVVYSDVTIREVQIQEDVTNIISAIDSVYLAETRKIAFVGAFELVEGATLVERGVLMTNDATLADGMTRETDGVIVGKISASAEGASPVFEVSKGNVTAGDTWYGRPYVTYSLQDETYTIYADTVSQKAE